MQKKRMAQETRKKNMCAAKNSQKIMSTRSAQNKNILRRNILPYLEYLEVNWDDIGSDDGYHHQ